MRECLKIFHKNMKKATHLASLVSNRELQEVIFIFARIVINWTTTEADHLLVIIVEPRLLYLTHDLWLELSILSAIKILKHFNWNKMQNQCFHRLQQIFVNAMLVVQRAIKLGLLISRRFWKYFHLSEWGNTVLDGC